MTAGNYNEKPGAEWEAVQRWENEGGKLRQHHDYRFGYIGEHYRRHLDHAATMGRLDTPNEIAHAIPIFVSREAKSLTGHRQVVDGERTLRPSVFAA